MSEDQLDQAPLAVPSQSWDAAERLCVQFPTIRRDEVVGALIEARRSVDLFGLSRPEQEAMAEKIAVEQLKQRIGESVSGSLARLDPEKHARRNPGPAPGA